MDFGEWVLRQRHERQLDVRSFGSLCDIDPSTISRIETKHSEVTLLTAFKICKGLGVGIDQLLADLGLALSHANSAPDYPILKIHHVERFLEIFQQSRIKAYELLAELLTLVARFRLAPDEENISFSGAEVEKLSLGMPLYSFEIRYPIVSNLTLKSICYFDGLIIRRDIARYLINADDFSSAKSSGTRAYNRKLIEANLERLKLADILESVDALSGDGILLKMFWQVLEFEALIHQYSVKLSPQEDSRRAERELDLLTDDLVKTFRWTDHLGLSVDSWLAQLK